MEIKNQIQSVVFDLGGVLIDWNPRYLYRKIFNDENKMEKFLATVCTPDWNEQQDAGRPLADATSGLISRFPEFRVEIEAFYGRWEEMLKGPIEPTMELLHEIKSMDRWGLYALTNWSAETFPIARERFTFLELFEDIIVSGVEKRKKPDPGIYRILLNRTGIMPTTTLFIDDSLRNIMAAEELGFQTVHFDTFERVDQIRDMLFTEA